MQHYYIRKVLEKDNLNQIREIIEKCNKNNLWIDGLSSGGGSKSIKHNLELSDTSSSQIINDIIMNRLDEDNNFINFVLPCSTTLNIISRMESGSYYKPHLDDWRNGDYSTTVFLNDPNEYEGGDLCLYFGGDDEIKIKLDAGWGITYHTGILHRVNKVKSGTRYVSVFWTSSSIKDSFIRYIYNELGNIESNIKNTNPIYSSDCISSRKDPLFCLDNLKTQILRKYSKN